MEMNIDILSNNEIERLLELMHLQCSGDLNSPPNWDEEDIILYEKLKKINDERLNSNK